MVGILARLCLLGQAQVIDKLRCGLDAGYQQVVPRAGAGDVKKVALGVVDLFEISVICNRFYPFLQWNDLIVTGHYDNGSEL